MKNIILLSVILLSSCSESQTTVKATTKQHDLVVKISKIKYVRDDRTGICFAYFWDGPGNGGPAFTSVNCENVKAHLVN